MIQWKARISKKDQTLPNPSKTETGRHLRIRQTNSINTLMERFGRIKYKVIVFFARLVLSALREWNNKNLSSGMRRRGAHTSLTHHDRQWLPSRHQFNYKNILRISQNLRTDI